MSSKIFKKIFSLLSVIRGYNILVLVAAQYLAAIFIFSKTDTVKSVIFDWHLLYLVISTACVIAAGYIINNFYDIKADRINRPFKSGIDNYVKQETQLGLYFFLNFLAFSIGALISWRVALFFSVYIFGIWFYSHKLKKYPLIGTISATILTLLPFFVIFIHYKNFSSIVFVHAFFLFLIILIREFIKDLENIQGAMVSNYKTFPIAYGEKLTKKLIMFLLMLTLIPIILLNNYPEIHYMKYYFYLSGIILIFAGIYLFKATHKNQYRTLHNILKILLLIGVFSLLFIDKSLIIEKITRIFL